MTRTPDVERFRALIVQRLGLHFDNSKLTFLEDVLRRRMEVNPSKNGAYLETLEFDRDGSRQEFRALARELTVTETYFFRNFDQFRAFTQLVVPERTRALDSRHQLRVLCAGCASGEEAYSVMMLLRQHTACSGWTLSVRAVDINPAMLEKAAQARYSSWSLRETPGDQLRRWFKPEGSQFALDESIRKAVLFEERNLSEENSDLWQPGAFDVVFCRNMLMYFAPEVARRVVSRIARALTPRGYLFLGHAETLRGLSQEFHLRHTHNTFYYQRREPSDQPSHPPPPLIDPSSSPPSVPWAAVLEGADSWVETIRRAAERIHALVTTPARLTLPSPAGSGVQPSEANWDLGLALELLKKERFADALDLMGALPAESAHDPDVLLLRGALLTHTGKLDQAERICSELLGVDELNAGAHYLLALCREGAGDLQGAVEHDQVASYLDPEFAMPRLHLGLLARRKGQSEDARRELGQALALMQREDTARLLLFGGGFSRDALLTLCRNELVGCGGSA